MGTNTNPPLPEPLRDAIERLSRRDQVLGALLIGSHPAGALTPASDDPRYLAVADIRVAVYDHADLWFGYFAIRGLPWPGDKAALRVLEAQDPGYLALFQQFIAGSRRAEKARRYADLATLAAAPLGGLWPSGWTGENLAHPPLRVADLLGEPGAVGQTARGPGA